MEMLAQVFAAQQDVFKEPEEMPQQFHVYPGERE